MIPNPHMCTSKDYFKKQDCIEDWNKATKYKYGSECKFNLYTTI
jgi:hypothetical protein